MFDNGGEGGTVLNNVKKIFAAGENVVVLKNDGSVWSWGDNTYGQLGIGTTNEESEPQRVLDDFGAGYLENIIDIALGENHVVALASNGVVWTWGRNDNGQLGSASATNESRPVIVDRAGGEYLRNVIKVSAGKDYTMVLQADGTIWTWGDNTGGKL